MHLLTPPDGHYSGTLRRRCIVPYRQPANGHLSPDQLYVNLRISFYRARAEHGIRRIKTPRMFDGVFRGSVPAMSDASKVWVRALACTNASGPGPNGLPLIFPKIEFFCNSDKFRQTQIY